MQCVIRPCRATFPPQINSRACTANRHSTVHAPFAVAEGSDSTGPEPTTKWKQCFLQAMLLRERIAEETSVRKYIVFTVSCTAEVVAWIVTYNADNNNTIDFYISHTPEIQINGLYNKNTHTKYEKHTCNIILNLSPHVIGKNLYERVL